MGYELDKLMKQFGVSTPGAVNYSGPAAPVVPTAPAALGADATDAEKAAFDKAKASYDAYQKDPSAFNDMMRKYGLAQKEYSQYLKDYQDRVMNTPQYTDQQYYTGPSAAMRYATGPEGMGAEKFYQNIRDTIAANPDMTAREARAAMDKYGITGYDVAQARGTPGSMWGNTTIANPTFGAVPVSLAGASLEEKNAYYQRLRNLGYTDEDIRKAAESGFGNIPNADWQTISTGGTTDGTKTTTDTTGGTKTTTDTTGGTKTTTTTADLPLYKSLTAGSSPADIAAAYNQYIGGPNADTSVNRATAEKYLQDIGVSPTTINQAYNTFLTTQETPLYTSLGAQSSAADVARAYNQYVAGTGGDTAANQQAAINYLQSIGVSPTTINQAYDTYKAGTFARGGSVRGMAQKYNVGGAVRRFQFGGNEGQPDTREEMPMPAVTATPGPLAEPPVSEAAALRPVTPPANPPTPMSPAATDLMGMLQRYGVGESVYAPELKAARARSDAETKAFTDMIQNAMKGQSYAPDKTEMYFRLASAFGAPTKTGRFAENLSMVGKELGEYAKESRTAKKAEQAMRLQLAMEAQKIKAQSAREELTGLRTLVGEEMKDKRALLQEYIKSGRPQSEAGKAAVDAGLQQGTPEFTNFVNSYIDDKIRSGNMLKEAMVAIAAGQLALGQKKEIRAEESSKKLTPQEVKLKSEAEANLGNLDDSMSALKRAYSLNPNTFDGTLMSIAQRKLLEQTDPKDPRVLATREQSNLLSKGAVEKLKASFGGNPTEGERKILLELEGIDSKSKEERALIMKNTYKLLQSRRAREQKRLNDITSGLYRETTPSAGEIE